MRIYQNILQFEFIIKSSRILLLLFLICFLKQNAFSYNDTIKNLVTAGKAFGAIKYSYPIKNFKTIDWDNNLISLVNKVKHAKNTDSVIRILDVHFKVLNENVIISKVKLNLDSLFQKKKTGPRIYCYLHHGAGIDNERHGLIKNKLYRTEIINMEFKALDLKKIETKIADDVFIYIIPPNKLRNISLKSEYKKIKTYIGRARDFNNRAASLLKLYFVIDLFYPYNNYNDDSLQEKLIYSLRKTVIDQDDNSFETTIRHFLSVINDGHAEYYLGYSGGLVGYFKPKFYPKISTRISNDSLYITQVDTSLKNLLFTNDQIITINNINTQHLISEKKKLVSAATNQYKILKTNFIIFESPKRDTVYNMIIKRKNGLVNISVASNNYLRFSNKSNREPIELLSDSIILLDLTNPRLTPKLIKKNIDILKNSKGVIFDLRGYPNYKADKVLSFFISKEVKVADFKVPLFINNNPLNKYDSSSWTIVPKNIIRKKCVYITHSTVSWGETLLEAIKYYQLGTIVGEPSLGTSGDIEKVTLPFGYFTYTGLIFSRDGKNPLPVIPDIYLNSNYYSSNINQDPFIQKAKSIILLDDNKK